MAAPAPGPAPGRRDALLIATDTYDDGAFRPLRSPGQDCAGLARALTDPRIGGFHAEQVKDAPAHQVMRAVERFFRDRSRNDLLLLHLSCHGIKDDHGHLHFAARDTDRDLPASTAMPAAFLRSQLERCRARTVVVLLDCCYSGAFLPGAKGDDQVHVRDELAGHGRVVLTATSRTEYAWEGERLETAAPQPSRFTGALIEGLTTGAADLDGDGRITVTELYDYVYESLHRAGARQRPRMWADLEYQVVIANVPARHTPPPPNAPPDAPPPNTPPPHAPPPNNPPPSAPPPPPATDASSPEDQMSFSEIMDAFFGRQGDGGKPKKERTRPGTDAVLRVDLELAESARGAVKELVVDTAILCPACSGTMTAPGTSVQRCAGCDGTGEVRKTNRKLFGGAEMAAECDRCRGFGTLIPHRCPGCGGDGRVRHLRTLKVRIPVGVRDGMRIQLAGEGEVGPGGGPAADLYVEIAERPHRDFTREGDDLRTRITVPRATAAAGGTARVSTLIDGDKTVRIPPRLRSGQALRLAGLGIPHLSDEGRGDLFVHVDVRG